MEDKIRIRCSKCNRVLLDVVETSVIEIKCHNCKKKYRVTVKEGKIIVEESK